MEYHCEHCRCPIEEWEPLETYNSDRSCEIFSDFFDVIWDLEKLNSYNYKMILNRCMAFQDKYPDIEDFVKTIQELIEIEIDFGVITDKYIRLCVI